MFYACARSLRRQALRLLNRLDLMRYAMLPPAGPIFLHFKLLAEPLAGKVKTTDVKAMGLDHMAGNCLIRIDTDTDTGLTGIGAAGTIALAGIETIKPLLIGKASSLSKATSNK
jgi:hypothetical protein